MNINYIKDQLNKLCHYKDIDTIAETLIKEDQALILKHAEDLMDNIFVFDKPWDMERCITPYQLYDIDWEMDPNGDEEWCFMLNRMDYLNYLMLASLIKKDKSYQKKGKEFILQWIASHNQITPKRSTRTLDTGIRVMNIFEALPFLYHATLLNDKELEIIIDNLMKQLEYMKEHYLLKYITSNWGSIQMCSVVSVLPFLDPNYKENEIFNWAIHELNTEMGAQVYPDGMHWEQSTMYHIEVLNYGMKALYYMSFHDITVSKNIYDSIYRLADALFYQVTPSKEIETFGDSDRTNIQDVFSRATVLFKNSKFKFLGYESFDCESLYTLGKKENEKYQNMAITIPEQKIFDGEDAGMYVMKSSWQQDASFTMFTNGSLGSGHGHSDNLHISVYYKGVPILIDAGRLTYREDDERRMKLKGMNAHNTILIDNHEYCMPSDSWGYQDFGRPLKNYVRHMEKLHYIEGSFIGHEPLSLITRKIVVIDPTIWFICDEISCDGKHQAVQSFHLDAEISSKEEYQSIIMEKNNLKMLFSHPITTVQDLCSIRYNEPLKNKTIKTKVPFTDFGIAYTAICDSSIAAEKVPVYQEKQNAMSDDCVTAMKFKLSDDESYTVVIFHKEVYKGKKIIFCENMPFHAKCVVIHEKNGQKALQRLKM